MKSIFISVCFIVLALSVMAQTGSDRSSNSKKPLVTSIDLGLGYVPQADIKALRVSVAATNLLLNRFGVYTAIENSFEDSYTTNVIGLTGSINHFTYVYGGVDLFSKHGFIKNEGFKGTRKDMGIGFYPYKWTDRKSVV